VIHTGLAGCRRVAQHVAQARAVETGRRGEGGQFAQGRVEIDGLGQRTGAGGRPRDARRGNDQGHARGVFVVGMLAPESVVAEMPAVVAPQDDHGVFGEPAAVERV